jgi:hypothetical protein
MIEKVETGDADDLSVMLAATLLDALGLRLRITPAHSRLNPKVSKENRLVVGGRTASTNYVG